MFDQGMRLPIHTLNSNFQSRTLGRLLAGETSVQTKTKTNRTGSGRSRKRCVSPGTAGESIGCVRRFKASDVSRCHREEIRTQ